LFSILVLSCTAIWPVESAAVDVAFDRLLLGNPWRSVIDDTTMYGPSYARFEGHYWDLFHERKNNTLHDYQQNALLLSTVYRRGSWLVGAELEREHLSLRQENVYTDDDRMTGDRNRKRALGIVGLSFTRGDYPLRVKRFEIIAAAGSNGEFTGFLEVGVAFENWVSVLFKGETFATRLETEEEMYGYMFPFHFPSTTQRALLRADVLPEGPVRVRVWGTYLESSGDGHAVKGLENRIYYESASAGLSVDNGLQLNHRLQVVPRLDKNNKTFLPFRVKGSYRAGRGDLGMRYDGTRYLLLDGLKTENVSIRADFIPRMWLAPYLGWDRLRISHSGRSFFDIWPFVIWDVFTSKRYRIGEFDGNLDTWYAGLGGMLNKGVSTFEWSGRFEWWQNSSDLVWFERIDILFPFFFDYERHDEAPELSPEYAIQLDAVLDLDMSRWVRLRFSGRATVPFSDSGGDSDPAPPGSGGGQPQPSTESGDMTHGGLSATVEWIIGF